MNLTLRQLRYVVSVADHGSIAAAARVCRISQSSILAAMAQAEHVMAARLFNKRPARGVIPTPAGDRFIGSARRFLEAESDFSRTIQGQANGMPTILRIGCFAPFGALFMQHCEDKALSNEGVMNEGLVSLKLGLRGWPKAAEASMAARDIVLAEATGGRIHFGHLSGRQSLDLLRWAKQKGLKVTAETAPHFFALSDAWLGEHPYDTHGKMNPPLGAEDDRLAVIEALKDGTLDAIATDHAPHSSLDKSVEFDKAAFGILGLETSLALTLDVLVHGGHISPLRAVELLSAKPAELLGLLKADDAGGHADRRTCALR